MLYANLNSNNCAWHIVNTFLWFRGFWTKGGRTVNKTQQPLLLFEHLLRSTAAEGPIVDVCCGSASVAGLRIGRNAVAFDSSSFQVECCKERLLQYATNEVTK